MLLSGSNPGTIVLRYPCMDTDIAIADALAQPATSAQPGSDVLFGLSVGGLAAGLAFSGLGLVYFKYGKTTGNTPMVISGVLLLLYPYFVSNTTYIIIVGLILAALPQLIERFS